MSSDISRRAFIQSGGLATAGLLAHGEVVSQPATAAPKTNIHVSMKINGVAYVADLEPRVTLLDHVHERLVLTGTRKGCNEGACGACTVLIDGKRMNACLTLAMQCHDREVTTIGSDRRRGGRRQCRV